MAVNPVGNVACNISPLRRAGLTSGFSPLICSVIVDSFASTVSTIAQLPHGKVCIVPTQEPANLLFGVGAGFAAARACVLGEDSDSAPLVFDFAVLFAFDFAGCSVVGVGLSSVIGAGNRRAVMNNRQQTRRNRATVRMSI